MKAQTLHKSYFVLQVIGPNPLFEQYIIMSEVSEIPFLPGVYAVVNPAQEDGIIASLSGALFNPPGTKSICTTVLDLYFMMKAQPFTENVEVHLFWFGNPPVHCALAVEPLPQDDLLINHDMAIFKCCATQCQMPEEWFGMIFYGVM